MPTSRAHTRGQNALVAEVVGDDVDETVTAADVDAAEQAAIEAEQSVEMLERGIEDGTDITTTAEQLETERGKSRIARLFAKGAQARADRAARARRLRACDDLRREIEACVGGAGADCVALLHTVEDAVKAFVEKIDERNRLVDGWFQRAQELGVTRHIMPIMPPKTDGHLAISGNEGSINGRGVIAGLRRVEQVSSLPLLRGVLSKIIPTTADTAESIMGKGGTGAPDPYGQLADLDADIDVLPPETVFYRGENGGVFAFDPDKVPDTVRVMCTRVSRQEVEKLGGKGA